MIYILFSISLYQWYQKIFKFLLVTAIFLISFTFCGSRFDAFAFEKKEKFNDLKEKIIQEELKVQIALAQEKLETEKLVEEIILDEIAINPIIEEIVTKEEELSDIISEIINQDGYEFFTKIAKESVPFGMSIFGDEFTKGRFSRFGQAISNNYKRDNKSDKVDIFQKAKQEREEKYTSKVTKKSINKDRTFLKLLYEKEKCKLRTKFIRDYRLDIAKNKAATKKIYRKVFSLFYSKTAKSYVNAQLDTLGIYGEFLKGLLDPSFREPLEDYVSEIITKKEVIKNNLKVNTSVVQEIRSEISSEIRPKVKKIIDNNSEINNYRQYLYSYY
ncbi:MAG: hypothetical protein SCARUB_01491 [Candidatus Scalindua rubra]|uniref:Uncharacterized protein n=1 Tax=Candidatus Scalindua rubra TaxID=1872076 RepID=A0A1E3XCN1_9BACT|nr:MAG: hypothetical protein SCARUB_01491 [Candidatus Scalindua rubra]